MMLVKTSLKPSSIHGIGLFAEQDISSGTVIWKFNEIVDKKITSNELKSLPNIAQTFLSNHSFFQDGFYILCGDNGRFINHSETPNIGDEEGVSAALRDIKIGEEITDNYNNYEIEPQWQPIGLAPQDGTIVIGRRSFRDRNNGKLKYETHKTRWGKASHVPLYGWSYCPRGDVENCTLWNPEVWKSVCQ